MQKYFLPLIIILLIASPAAIPKKTTLKLKAPVEKSGRARSQTHGKSHISAPLEADSLQFITLCGDISFSGYDKPATSRHETFLITNSSAQHLKGVGVRIVYRDPSGRMLHSRDEEILIDIPPGETRQVEIRSFDTQQTYYYHLSLPPKRRPAQPFQVDITTIRILLPR